MTIFWRSLIFATCSTFLLGASAVAAEVFVIVNAAAPESRVDRDRLEKLYFGRSRSFADGAFAQVIDRPDSPLRERFFRALSGMSLPQVNAYWARLSFTGRVLPLAVRETDVQVVAIVRAERNAIGYVASAPDDSSVRVIMRLE